MGIVIDTLNSRLAGRAISGENLPEAAVADMMQAARLTPSCYNNQPWRFLFLESDDALSKGRDALTGGNRTWAVRAPLLIVGYSCEADDCVIDDGRKYHQFDLGMAVMNLMLCATEYGLLARPMAGFNPEKIRESFELGEDYRPLVMIAVGYPSMDESHLPDYYKGLSGKPRIRKPVEEIVSRL